MNIIIIADKFQKRMKSKGCVGLIKNNKTTLIQEQYSVLKKTFPQAKIIYVYGFDSKRFQAFLHKHEELQDIEPIYNKYYEQYNTMHSLSLVQTFLRNNCLIMLGDCKINKTVFNKFDINNGSQIFIDNNSSSEIGCILSNNIVQNIAYDLDNKLSDIYYLTREHAHCLSTMIDDNNYNNYFLFEAINKIIDNNHIIKPYFFKGCRNETSSIRNKCRK